jgi:hypothetical protein
VPVNSASFFIVGSGRSGTTLLRMILASHSRITIPPETWFLLPLLRRLEPGEPLSAAQVEFAVRTITNHYRWPDMQLSAVEFRRRVRTLRQPFLRDVVEVIYQEHMERENKPRWGDKTPGYIEVVPQLMRLFPKSKFIYLCRDGRDVVKSFQRTGWYGPWLHDNIREWNEALDYRERWRHSDLNDQIFDVRYEDLILDTENTVRNICNFLAERFESQMLAWQSRVDDLLPAREMPVHQNLRRPPVSTDVNRWRREMTAREVFVCEAFMGKQLDQAGYCRKFRSPLWAPAFQLTRWHCIGLSSIAQWPLKIFAALRRRLFASAADRRQVGSGE